ncbi:biopolymer transporter ExbD [Parapedobacter sp. ISTM3]|uniref:Biopolymer transport protein ExbD/TolR n=1 Tax=Parapedobacter luteus TaxID=623280 RepID=A0A1T5EEX1_9SPHI|nr:MULTISPECIES: biopolymer transporter ExbD [Parapedobacter]MBK1441138.1 biopolymer transporter ExbD [Parapedobacter sp. ISTM3]SKB82677.1 Biopolymer transport protein ExbD/TolR [Parapedobacter luteus]
MPRVKVKRASTTIDMTAMCDVSFLLLTFFILTATARQPEPMPVDTPASATQVKLPDDDLGLITVGDGGKVFFGVVNRNARARMLELMSEKYSIAFTPEEKAEFSTMESFGVPMGNLKQLINLGTNDRVKPGLQPGIPIDSTDALSNELFHWIYSARVATKELKNAEMRVSIKGDANEKYPEIKKVMDVLQSQKVNKFSLITSLRSEDF